MDHTSTTGDGAIERLVCSYHSCPQCHYVGEDIDFGQRCPVCTFQVTNSLSVWPNNQWHSACDDIQFLFTHEKLELLTIATASYFEGVLWSFFYDAFILIYSPTCSLNIDVSHVSEEGERFVEEQKEHRRRQQLIRDTMKKFRDWPKRLGTLCTELFGASLDDLLRQHFSRANLFITNRDNIHKWRNEILHKGVPLDQVWSESMQREAPRLAVEFVKECWAAFCVLNNELIHEPYWREVRAKKAIANLPRTTSD